MSYKNRSSRVLWEQVPSIEGHGPVHYLPHLPVVRTDRTTTKIRVLYNGSAKTSD